MPRLKPVAVDVEKAVVGPVARGDEEDQEEDRAVDARPVEKVREEKERYHKSDWLLVHGIFIAIQRIAYNGEAFVGMKRSGSQLGRISTKTWIGGIPVTGFTSVDRT